MGGVLARSLKRSLVQFPILVVLGWSLIGIVLVIHRWSDESTIVIMPDGTRSRQVHEYAWWSLWILTAVASFSLGLLVWSLRWFKGGPHQDPSAAEDTDAMSGNGSGRAG